MEDIGKTVVVGVGGAVGTATATSTGLGLLGFTAGGIVQGSAAAAFMASYGGTVASGSACAILQSLGTASVGSLALGPIGGVGFAAATIGFGAYKYFSRKNEGKIPSNELEKGEKIGEGDFGVVYKGKWKDSPVAIKMCQSMPRQTYELIRTQLVSLKLYPNVVQVFGVCGEPECRGIVMEYLSGGSLLDYLKKQKEPLPISRVVGLIEGISAGVLHLHSEKIIHGNLATRNILLTPSGTPKISDFGFLHFVEIEEEGKKITKFVGPFKYMSPEFIKKLTYSTESDVWSFGIVVWEILTRQEPFSELSLEEAANKIVNERVHPPIPEDIPESMKELLRSCWEFDPSQRPSFKNIYQQIQSWNFNE